MAFKRRYLSDTKRMSIANMRRDMPAGATRRGGLPLTSFVGENLLFSLNRGDNKENLENMCRGNI